MRVRESEMVHCAIKLTLRYTVCTARINFSQYSPSECQGIRYALNNIHQNPECKYDTKRLDLAPPSMEPSNLGPAVSTSTLRRTAPILTTRTTSSPVAEIAEITLMKEETYGQTVSQAPGAENWNCEHARLGRQLLIYPG